jgi:hypothetical protein
MKRQSKQYALCLSNRGHVASLDKRKIYEIVPDVEAARQDMVRVIDESGEDYLYPKTFFVLIQLPKQVEEAFLTAA